MNASEQALSLEITSKIASIVNLFRQEFPDAHADLRPWANDADTRDLVDPNSIDIGFHFPGWSPRFQSRSILVQIRLLSDQDHDPNATKAIGAELSGFSYAGKQWRLSTVQTWEFAGEKTPNVETQFQLKRFCRKLLEVFNGHPEGPM
jgi:hypothetical protein